jgi:ATP/maltotriose-dependent transcriptional regulator MalT
MAGVVREFLGEMSEASLLLERARELHDPAEHDMYLALYGTNLGLLARAMSSRPLWALGFPDRALARARETLALADAVREPMARTFARLVLHGVLAYRGDAAAAEAIGEENIALCREHGLPQEAEWSRSFQGSALITLGRIDEGLALLRDSVAVQERLETYLARPMFLAVLADGLLKAGRVDEGLAAVSEGFTFAARTGEGGYVAELHRVRGQLLQLRGDLAGAEASLREALAYAARQTARSLELRAATALARLLGETGRRAEARHRLADVHDWFTEGFETADVVTARTLLSEMG